jgi:hypothetical protein
MGRRAIGLAVVTALCIVATAATGNAESLNGGNSIASAVHLKSGQQASGGGRMGGCELTSGGAEFYKITIPAGSVLTIDFASVDANGVYVDILRPAETDFTLANAGSVAHGYTEGKQELSFRANVTGDWIMAVSGNCGSDFGYTLQVRLQGRTSVTLRGPKKVRPNHSAKLSGIVAGATSGYVTLENRNGGGWQQFSQPEIHSGGGYSDTVTFNGHCGERWTIRAVYSGDSGHPAGISNSIEVHASC